MTQAGQRVLTPRELELLDYCVVHASGAVNFEGPTIKDWAVLKKLLVALGGKWCRGNGKKPGFFQFDAVSLLRLEQAQATQTVLDPKELDAFFTPDPLSDRVVRDVLDLLCDRLPGPEPIRILEPSAGKGSLLRACQRYFQQQRVQRAYQLYAVEFFQPHVDFLRENLPDVPVVAADFECVTMWRPQIPKVHGVVMNPPFTHYIPHIHTAWDALLPGGLLAAIVPRGIEFRKDKAIAQFREWCLDRGTIVSLPPKSFAPASGVETSLVVLRDA